MRVIKSVSFVWLVTLALLLSACEGLHAQERETKGLQTHVGDGFSLQYPANAQVESASRDPGEKARFTSSAPMFQSNQVMRTGFTAAQHTR